MFIIDGGLRPKVLAELWRECLKYHAQWLSLVPEVVLSAPEGPLASQQTLELLVVTLVDCLDVPVDLGVPLA